MDEGPRETQEQRSHETTAVGGGESLGEAKWAAMKELETRFPGITAEAVRFAVVEEPSGESGTARVEAEVDVEAWRQHADDLPDEPAERVRAVVGRIAQALGLRASVDIEETDDEVRATVNGDDLGQIGRAACRERGES